MANEILTKLTPPHTIFWAGWGLNDFGTLSLRPILKRMGCIVT